MIIAPGADDLAEPLPKIMKANNTPKPGPGLVSNKNRIDLPVCKDCSVPSGVKIPWLMALFKNKILAGSIKIFANGYKCALIIASTPLAIALVND